MRQWQNRPLDPVYPVVFFDALRVKIRDEGLVKNMAVYAGAGAQPGWREGSAGAVDRADRRRQILAQGDQRTQGARRQHLIAVVDGLKGSPEAITSVYPETAVQTCIVGSLKKSSFSPDPVFVFCRGGLRAQ